MIFLEQRVFFFFFCIMRSYLCETSLNASLKFFQILVLQLLRLLSLVSKTFRSLCFVFLPDLFCVLLLADREVGACCNEGKELHSVTTKAGLWEEGSKKPKP